MPTSPKARPAPEFVKFKDAMAEIARLQRLNDDLASERAAFRAAGRKIDRRALKAPAAKIGEPNRAEQYQAITNPREKTLFWQRHKAAIVANAATN